MARSGNRHGFTLVEISIVLIIIGMIVGGVLAGQNLVRSAKVKTMLEQKENIITSINLFRERFDALPGDMPNATDIWGAADNSGADGTCGDPCTDVGTGTQTCNGNGNGRLSSIIMSCAAGGDVYEDERMWQHLFNAELIEGKFDGISDKPLTPFGKTAWSVIWVGEVDSGSGGQYFDGDYRHVIQTGIAGALHYPLSAEELRNIDVKLDDGMPATGEISSHTTDNPANIWVCAIDPATELIAAYDDFNAEYKSSGGSCRMVIRNALGR